MREDAGAFKAGDRVAAFCMLGGFAEVALAQPHFTFKLPDELDFAQGAGLILNYHTAYFALKTRGRLSRGRDGARARRGGRRRHGLAAGREGPGRADDRGRVQRREGAVAREAGADEVLRSDGDWKDEAKALGGADLVLDPVGGDRFTDSLRSLNRDGRCVVVGFTGGSIPEVSVNRLLLNNIDVVGAGWGAYIRKRPEIDRGDRAPRSTR